jgi:GNAT superfamily N-acetyltransferase
MRQLAIADVADVLELQASVGTGLPAGFVRSKTEVELRAYLDGALGVAYGIVERAALVAMALLRIPDESHPNIGPPFPLVPEGDWPLSACFLESTMVRPAARGRGYQRRLVDARFMRAASAGMRWVCAGVALRNAVSWANLLARGMAIAGIRFDPGYPVLGLLRSSDPTRLTTDPSDQVTVRAEDPARHQAALLAGYVGVRPGPGGAVTYRRLLSLDARGKA